METYLAGDPAGPDALRAAHHSSPGHALCPPWWGPAIAGEHWIVGDELIEYIPHRENSWLFIWRDGMFQTAYPAARRHLENVLVSRLERLGWRSLFRAPRVGRKRVMQYFGITESVPALVPREA
jgi:hypothetical protein